ncbi:MAG: hypothetical protein KKB70_03035 [Proteobacteria bacterium]|nr:hypothetical protein [Pseudomonadota bacterium]
MLAERILSLVDDPEAPEQLETLYREEAGAFAEALPAALAKRPESMLLRAWSARLAPAVAEPSHYLELWLVVAFALLAGFFVKLPDIFPISDEFYARSISFGPLGALIFYLLQVNDWPRVASWAVGAAFGLTALYMNLIPESWSDTYFLILLHGPLFLWCVAAVAFAGVVRPTVATRRAWVRFFGELVVFSGLLMLGGGVLLVLTAGLFELLDAPLEWIYRWMLPMGAAAIPVVSAWAVKRREAGGRIMPLLARIFAPLFLVILCAYLLLLAMDPTQLFSDRETLLMYNILLLSVLGLTVFSLSGQDGAGSRALHLLLAWLVGLTVLFDGLGLAAIVSRIVNQGITPNRLAVLGANLVVLGNLLFLLKGFYALLQGRKLPEELEQTTASYLPVFAGWTLFVCIGFPLMFA